jgi:hypothetical protein
VIAPNFAQQQVYLTARVITTSKGHTGGALNYDRVKSFILNCLKENESVLVTTFFDLYGLDKRFPGFIKSQAMPDVYQRTQFLEQALKDDVAQSNTVFLNRFLPYLQPYEFEGLLFSDISKLTDIHAEWSKALIKLQADRDEFETPEHINNSYETKPSERIKDALNSSQIFSKSKKSYRKTYHGPLAIQEIGVDKLCLECKHFADWYQQLANLGTA